MIPVINAQYSHSSSIFRADVIEQDVSGSPPLRGTIALGARPSIPLDLSTSDNLLRDVIRCVRISNPHSSPSDTAIMARQIVDAYNFLKPGTVFAMAINNIILAFAQIDGHYTYMEGQDAPQRWKYTILQRVSPIIPLEEGFRGTVGLTAVHPPAEISFTPVTAVPIDPRTAELMAGCAQIEELENTLRRAREAMRASYEALMAL